MNSQDRSTPAGRRHLVTRVLAGLAVAAFLVGLIVGATTPSGAERVTKSFASAWQRGNLAAMHKELSNEGIKSTALCPGFVDTPMTDFVKGSVAAEDMITPGDIAETVRLLLKVSPACIIPEVQFLRPGD